MQHNNRANILFLREQAEAFGTKIILYTFYRTQFLTALHCDAHLYRNVETNGMTHISIVVHVLAVSCSWNCVLSEISNTFYLKIDTFREKSKNFYKNIKNKVEVRLVTSFIIFLYCLHQQLFAAKEKLNKTKFNNIFGKKYFEIVLVHLGKFLQISINMWFLAITMARSKIWVCRSFMDFL